MDYNGVRMRSMDAGRHSLTRRMPGSTLEDTLLSSSPVAIVCTVMLDGKLSDKSEFCCLKRRGER